MPAAPTVSEGRGPTITEGSKKPKETPKKAEINVVRAPGMKDDVLRIRAEVILPDCVKSFVAVLIDTGAQISLVRKGLFPPEMFRAAENPVILRGANSRRLQRGDREIQLDLVMTGTMEDTGSTQKVRAPGWFYEAEITDEVIVSYTWLGERGFDVSPRRHGMKIAVGTTSLWIPGVPASDSDPPVGPALVRCTSAKPRRALDLFSGTGSAAETLRACGFEVKTVDCDVRRKPDWQVDVMAWDYKKELVPGEFDLVVAAPPCTEFSRALTTRERRLKSAFKLVEKTLEIIQYLRPATWWLETPAHGMLAMDPTMLDKYPYVDCDHCQFSDYGYQKPTRFFGSSHLELLASVKCDQRTCPSLVEDPSGLQNPRRHKNSQGGRNGYVKREKAYRIPPSLVKYVSGLAEEPERRCKPPGRNQT